MLPDLIVCMNTEPVMDSLMRTLGSRRKQKRSSEEKGDVQAPEKRQTSDKEKRHGKKFPTLWRFTFMADDETEVPLWSVTKPVGRMSQIPPILGSVKDNITQLWDKHENLNGMEPVFRTPFELDPVDHEALSKLVSHPVVTPDQELKLRIVALSLHYMTHLACEVLPHAPYLCHHTELPSRIQPMWLFGICEALAAFKFINNMFKRLRIDYGNLSTVFSSTLAAGYFFCELADCTSPDDQEIPESWDALHRMVATPLRFYGSFLDTHFMIRRVVFISPLDNSLTTIEDMVQSFPDVAQEHKLWQRLAYAKRLRFTNPKVVKPELLKALAISMLPKVGGHPLIPFDMKMDVRFPLNYDKDLDEEENEENHGVETQCECSRRPWGKDNPVVKKFQEQESESDEEDAIREGQKQEENLLIVEVEKRAAEFNKAKQKLAEFRRSVSPTSKGLACLEASSDQSCGGSPLLSRPGPSAPITISSSDSDQENEILFEQDPYEARIIRLAMDE